MQHVAASSALALVILISSVSAKAERCIDCPPPMSPFPVEIGSVWYSDPGGVPGRPSTFRNTDSWPPTRLDGRRMGSFAMEQGSVPFHAYDVTDIWGRGFSGPQQNIPAHGTAYIGGRYSWYSAETNNQLNTLTPFNITFPSYSLFNGSTLNGAYHIWSHIAQVASVVTGGPSPYSLTFTARNADSPYTVSLTYVDAVGTVHEHNIANTAWVPQGANINADLGDITVEGTIYYRQDSYQYSEIAINVKVKAANVMHSYLVIHSDESANPSGYNDWQIAAASVAL